MINISEYRSTPYITINGKCINCDNFLIDINKNDVYNNEFIIDLSDGGLEFICDNNLKYDNRWKLLKYEIDGFFKNHINKLGKYTALLFPPNNFNLKGGDLIFNIRTPQEKIIKTELFTKYTLVLFPINICYEITPVENGIRYVFKKILIDSISNDSKKLNFQV